MNQYPAIPVSKIIGDEPFFVHGHPLPFNLLSFWQWSSSDLVGNALRGVLAEYILATAVRCTESTRTEWDAFDIETSEGIKVEVKSGAYIQSWAQKKLSAVQFGIRPTQGWDSKSNTYLSKKTRQSDVYVFCVLSHKNQETINPLNLDQWTFHVISTSKINDAVGAQKTITLTRLLQLTPREAKYGDIYAAIKQVAECSS